MTLLEFTLLAFSSLFVIVDPLAMVPVFLAMTPNDSPRARLRMARLACAVAAGTLILFALAGQWIFRLLGITLPAFQLAGSLLLLIVALDMLQARASAARETVEEVEAGAEKDDIAITPLAVPMLAGPGAISTVLILLNQAETFTHRAALFLCVIAVLLITYIILHLGVKSARWLHPLAMKLITRLMGLLLAALAIQFAINALMELPFFERG